ncbi:DUF1415 domain-containing protein [Litorilituus lipolyticus]|uniref:DUF1415 domain-containing protein n=1 Tax=Litorilituus lipolyticus TaxID=2491017 RepID=A0A502KW47_9GAMM|nr:DUF1415 domain-containing protein [Litorilituus lipolyticus]TPH15898.1 DUF1415 domain-containing protein [Litorilituus lipolyticus]
MSSIEKSVINATKDWLEQVIIGLNFCPFAKKEFVQETIFYHVSSKGKTKAALVELLSQFQYLKQHSEIETTLVIYQDSFRSFDNYLDLVDQANELLIDEGFEGIFQLASMHPEYCFADEDYDDASNFTNRSPFPLIHIIREDSMAKVLSHYKEPEKIPETNVNVAQAKGSDYFKQLLENIHIKHST